MSNLKQFRKQKNLTQLAMAQKLGITLSLYEKVESGRAGASAKFMRRIKNQFPDANIEALFFEK